MAEPKDQPIKHAPPAPNEKRSDDEIARIIEKARQKVKPIVKKEAEGELITTELLGLRLKAQ